LTKKILLYGIDFAPELTGIGKYTGEMAASLAAHLAQTQSGLRGFTRSNLFRMRKFFETYQGDEVVAPLARQLPWTHNLIILNQI